MARAELMISILRSINSCVRETVNPISRAAWL